jgi:hypothetical protein
MRRFPILTVVALLQLQVSSSGSAQEVPVLVPGARVRITESNVTQRGTILTAGADTVTLRPDRREETIAISRTGITRVELSRGLHGHTGAGIGLGFLAGLGVCALVGYNSCGTCGGGEDDQTTKMLSALAWGGILGGAGILVGGVIGAHHKTDRWEEVPSSRWRVAGVPSRGGFAVALARSW